MKVHAKKLLLVTLIPLCVALSFFAFKVWYELKYSHQHCIKQAGLAFRLYASEHNGQLPFSTNGFGDALLLLAGSDSTNDYLAGFTACLCGPDDDGHVFIEALKNHSVVQEEQCSRVYIQGLSETSNPDICILFDRNSCRGGDHARSPWRHRVREVSMLDGSMQVIRDEAWPEFSRRQVELLVAAGFPRTNAVHFYPLAQ